MKSCFLLAIITISAFTLNSQNLSGTFQIPLKEQHSPAYADDIIINDQPGQDQRNVTVCSAYNGWLYSAYTYYVYPKPWFAILKSEDEGANWTMFYQESFPLDHFAYTKFDLMVCGDSLNNLKLFFLNMVYDSATGHESANVGRCNAITGEFEDPLFFDFNGWTHDMAFASDFGFPANGSDPYSLAVIYSKKNIFDSVIVLTSSNGGMSLDKRQYLSGGGHYLDKVDISYAWSPSENTGRYCAVWEERLSPNAASGNIFTSHSDPDFNSPFTAPVQLDLLDTALTQMVRNPVIASQSLNADNLYADLSEVILCQKYNSGSSSYDVVGFANNRFLSTDSFVVFYPGTSQGDQVEPSVCFNPYDSSFTATWYDAQDHKLPLVSTNYRLGDPNTWTVVSSGYNDSGELDSPWPMVKIDQGKHAVMNVWSGLNSEGHGVALFDAPYRYYTGTNDQERSGSLVVSVFPNPANEQVTISLECKDPGTAHLTLISPLGQPVITKSYQFQNPGNQMMTLQTFNLSRGLYFYTINLAGKQASGKLVVNH